MPPGFQPPAGGRHLFGEALGGTLGGGPAKRPSVEVDAMSAQERSHAAVLAERAADMVLGNTPPDPEATPFHVHR